MDGSAELRTRDNRPAPMLKYSKKVDGTYYVVEAIPESKYKKFWVVSAYMEKAGGGTQAPNANDPGNTPIASLASSPTASAATVSQPPRPVNPSMADSFFQDAADQPQEKRRGPKALVDRAVQMMMEKNEVPSRPLNTDTAQTPNRLPVEMGRNAEDDSAHERWMGQESGCPTACTGNARHS